MKKKYKIEKRSGTVLSCEDSKAMVFGSDRLIYWIDLKSGPFSKIKVIPGTVLWLYCVPQKNHVLTVMKDGEQNEPPETDECVELEE